jgi:hypothetical protein
MLGSKVSVEVGVKVSVGAGTKTVAVFSGVRVCIASRVVSVVGVTVIVVVMSCPMSGRVVSPKLMNIEVRYFNA